MKSKALLINPPSGLYRRDDRCQSRVEDQTVNIIFPPMDLAQLGAMAKRAGADVRIEDLPATDRSWDDLEQILQEYQPDILLFSTTTPTIEQDLCTAEMIKGIKPDCVTVGKGEYLAVNGEKVLKENPSLDVILTGEPEITFEEICKGKNPDEIQGILFRKKIQDADELVRTERRGLIKDLDSLPFPARDLLKNELYRSPETGNPLTVIQANRGCPSHCIFCPAGKIYGYSVRLRSPQNIVEEVKECVEQFGIREFLFNGDTFTINKSWVLKLCDLIVKEGLDIHWGCNSRVDTFDKERAGALKKAGCWVVAFGIESGVQEMLDKMKKKTKVEKAFEAVRVAKNAGLRTHAFYIIGLPWETKETLKKTYQFARRLDTDFFDFNIAYPLPGTEYYEIAKAEGLFETAGSGSYANAAVRSKELSSKQLTEWRKKALLKLYLRPGYILCTLSRVITKPVVLKNYLREGFRRILSLIR